MRNTVTKKRLADMKDNPEALFPGFRVTFHPDSQEIWIKSSKDPNKFLRVRLSEGPAGFGVQVSTRAGEPDLDVFTVDGMYNAANGKGHVTGNYIEIVQYNQDPRSQEFREACIAGGESEQWRLYHEKYRNDPEWEGKR